MKRFHCKERFAGSRQNTGKPLFRSVIAMVVLTAPCLAGGASAQEEDVDREALELGPVVVTATRSETPVSAIPGSVTVITREEIERQAAISHDLGAILAREVPGFAPSTQSLSNFGETLRGRNFLVLIDGVPQSSPLRDVSRDLRTIDPAAIERVEVIRGATAIYGFGAAGGIINFITRKGEAGKPVFTTELGANLSLTHPDDSLGGRLTQTASGRTGRLDYTFVASGDVTQSFFDAEGDRIPPDPKGQGGLADSGSYDLLGKLGFDLGGGHRLQFTGNYYETKQDTDFVSLPGIVGVEKATATEGDVPGENQGTENLVLNLDYGIEDVLGSQLDAQLYYQDLESLFAFTPFFGGSQSVLTSEKIGARLSLTTPIQVLNQATLTWGIDYLHDETEQKLVDGRDWVPPIEQSSYAPFAQIEVPIGERFLWRGGVRHERIKLDVDSFITLSGGNVVQGGELDYSETLFNLGGVFFVNDNVELFASYSQGFSVADIGRELRSMTAASVEVLQPEGQIVDNYEVGVRGGWGMVDASLAFFLSKSDLGTTFGNAPEFQIQRQKERVYGVEATLDIRPADDWRLGGTLSLAEGRYDTDADDDLDEYLPGDRISPAKLTAYIGYDPEPWWRVRLQALAVGDRDRFGGSTAFGEGEVESVVTFDLYSELEVGPGTLRLAVQNLLNEQYITPFNQASNLDSDYVAARGALASVSYKIRY